MRSSPAGWQRSVSVVLDLHGGRTTRLPLKSRWIARWHRADSGRWHDMTAKEEKRRSGGGAGRQLRRAMVRRGAVPRWNGDTSRLGIYGSSSGGHVAEPRFAMRPTDLRYNAISTAGCDTSTRASPLRSVRSPISDTAGRSNTRSVSSAAGMVTNNTTFFSISRDHPRKQPAGDSRSPRTHHHGADVDYGGSSPTTTCRRSSSRSLPRVAKGGGAIRRVV